MTWLTPPRLKAATIAIMVVAFVVPSVALTGTTKPPPHHAAHAAAAR